MYATWGRWTCCWGWVGSLVSFDQVVSYLSLYRLSVWSVMAQALNSLIIHGFLTLTPSSSKPAVYKHNYYGYMYICLCWVSSTVTIGNHEFTAGHEAVVNRFVCEQAAFCNDGSFNSVSEVFDYVLTHVLWNHVHIESYCWKALFVVKSYNNQNN